MLSQYMSAGSVIIRPLRCAGIDGAKGNILTKTMFTFEAKTALIYTARHHKAVFISPIRTALTCRNWLLFSDRLLNYTFSVDFS